MNVKIKRPLTLYLDTSVPSFLLADDAPDKQKVTQNFFKNIRGSQYQVYVSGIVTREIEKAPPLIRDILLKAVSDFSILDFTLKVEDLAQAYLQSSVFPQGSVEDARHVAIATVHNLDAVVSWNFKHLVNLRRVHLVNLVNQEMGYKHIEIISPQEVIFS